MEAHAFLQQPLLLMEGALGERLKRDYGLTTNGEAGMAHLVYDPRGRVALREIWRSYIAVAAKYGLPFLATTPTRRANRDSLQRAGLGSQAISDNVAFLRALRDETDAPILAGGMMGCPGNAYTGEGCLPFAQSRELHRWAATRYQAAGADFLFAAILPTMEEALGIACAMAETDLPYLISFTIQSDGRLIDGTPIADAIAAVDAQAPRPPAFFMSNCVHPNIVQAALSQPFNQTDIVRKRFLGLQANTADLPFEALDASPVLHTSPPDELAAGMLALRRDFGFRLFGGCCGTDERHMEAIARAITADYRESDE